jgi:hypothetical protein
MKKETIRKILLSVCLLFCLFSLLYPPYYVPGVGSNEFGGYRPPEYSRHFILTPASAEGNIDTTQLLCELGASLTAFSLIKLLLK